MRICAAPSSTTRLRQITQTEAHWGNHILPFSATRGPPGQRTRCATAVRRQLNITIINQGTSSRSSEKKEGASGSRSAASPKITSDLIICAAAVSKTRAVDASQLCFIGRKVACVRVFAAIGIGPATKSVVYCWLRKRAAAGDLDGNQNHHRVASEFASVHRIVSCPLRLSVADISSAMLAYSSGPHAPPLGNAPSRHADALRCRTCHCAGVSKMPV